MYHLHIACNVGVAELLDMRQRFLAIIVLMALDVGLILKIDAVLIAQIVPVWSVGIVTVAHVVDVAALHKEHFVLHLLTRYVVACSRIVLMTVHTLHLDGLSVEIIVAACQSELVLFGRCILNLYLAEAYVCRECLYRIALLVLQFAHESVAMRSLSTPRFNNVAGLKRHESGKVAVLVDVAYDSSSTYARHESVLVGIETVFV